MPAPEERDKDFPFVIGPLHPAVGSAARIGPVYTIPAPEPRDAETTAGTPGVPARAAA